MADYSNSAETTTPPKSSSCSTYFDSLPHEVLLKIVSETVASLAVKTKPQFFNFLFSDSNPLHAVVPQMFSSLILVDDDITSEAYFNKAAIKMTAKDLHTSSQNAALISKIFEVCGKSITQVSVLQMRLETTTLKDFTLAVTQHCPNVNVIKIDLSCRSPHGYDHAWKLLERYAPQLHGLDCHVIRWWLGRDFEICSNLKQFVCEHEYPGMLATALKAFGFHLEGLIARISDHASPVELFHVIQKYCRRLTVLLLDSATLACYSNEYASMLCSYGTQLVEAFIDPLGINHLRQVCNICRCLRIKFSLSSLMYHPEDWARIEMIGPLMEYLAMQFNYELPGSASRSMARCTNVRELSIDRMSVYDHEITTDQSMSVLFSSSCFKAVEKLCIGKFNPSTVNLHLIAASTLKLREIAFTFVEPIVSTIGFEHIVHSNRTLDKVSLCEKSNVRCTRSAESTVALLGDLLKTFSKCCTLSIFVKHAESESVAYDELHKLSAYIPCRGIKLSLATDSSKYSQNCDS